MSERFDLLIRHGTVVDGTRAPRYAADVAVSGGRIARIGALPAARADREIDAAGKIVAPGFIDAHTHDDVVRAMNLPRDEAIARLLPAGAIYFSMDEADVQRILGFERTMVGSDGLPHDAAPHPRLWGTFPRVLGHYARELGLFPLETAVHKMTGLTATTFGLKDRGVVREGACADLTVFDAGTVGEAATFAQPIAPARGIEAVIVNGAVVWLDGRATGARPGQVLRRQPD